MNIYSRSGPWPTTIKTTAAPNPKPEAKSDLPAVESPPLSPAGEVIPLPAPRVEPTIAPEPDETSAALPPAWRRRMRARHQRQAVLAASVTIAACIGAIIGALAMSGMSTPTPDKTALHERETVQQSIAQLNKQIAALKADIDAGSKSARSQIAKISERLNRPSEPEATGSIAPPATVPTPTPRPDMRATVVHDWRIYNVRDGIVAVEGHGEIYEIGIGAPLPGLGPVQQIKRENGRWVVVTPHGLIVSQRDRRFFEPN